MSIGWITLGSYFDLSEDRLLWQYKTLKITIYIKEMAFELAVKCDLVCGFLRCGSPEIPLMWTLTFTLWRESIHKRKITRRHKSPNTAHWELKSNHTLAWEEKMKELVNRQNNINTPICLLTHQPQGSKKSLKKFSDLHPT